MSGDTDFKLLYENAQEVMINDEKEIKRLGALSDNLYLENVKIKGLLEHIKNDLLLRADEDPEGAIVVDLSSSIWRELKDTLSETA